MALLDNGLETIELGMTGWRTVYNNNLTKVYSIDQVYTKTEIDEKLNLLIPPLQGNANKYLRVNQDETGTYWSDIILDGYVSKDGDTMNNNLVFPSHLGIVLKDKTTGKFYRLKIDNGTIGTEEVFSSIDYDPFKDSSGVHLYTFNNTLDDSSPNAKNGTAPNGIEYVAGKFDNAVYFGQNNEIVEIDDLVIPIFESNSVSVVVWVANIYTNRQNRPTDGNIIASAADEGKTGIRSSFSVDVLSTWQGQTVNFSSSMPQDDDWHLYAFTVDPNEKIKVYIDGNLVATSSQSQVNDSGTDGYPYYSVGMTWHNYVNQGAQATFLKLDNLRIFNRALTQDEINLLYQYEM